MRFVGKMEGKSVKKKKNSKVGKDSKNVIDSRMIRKGSNLLNK